MYYDPLTSHYLPCDVAFEALRVAASRSLRPMRQCDVTAPSAAPLSTFMKFHLSSSFILNFEL